MGMRQQQPDKDDAWDRGAGQQLREEKAADVGRKRQK